MCYLIWELACWKIHIHFWEWFGNPYQHKKMERCSLINWWNSADKVVTKYILSLKFDRHLDFIPGVPLINSCRSQFCASFLALEIFHSIYPLFFPEITPHSWPKGTRVEQFLLALMNSPYGNNVPESMVSLEGKHVPVLVVSLRRKKCLCISGVTERSNYS